MWRRDAAAVGVAGVALGDIHLRFTWQAWYLVTSTSTLAWQAWHLWHWAGSGGALGFKCGAGTPRLLAWQAWHLETSIFVSRGRCGILGDIDFYSGVAGVALMALVVARLVLGVVPGRRGCWRGRRGTWRHPSSLHVAGVVLAHNLLTHNLLTHTTCHHTTCSHTTCRHTTYSGVAGVALMALGWLWWRAWF